MVTETISIKCTEHSYQHSASDLALMLIYVCNQGGSTARSYCGATCNTSLCVMTKGGGASYYAIIIFLNICLNQIDTPPAAFFAEF